VIIPTRNEAQAIGRFIGDLPADLVAEVIVVDNNSTDGTPEIAARMGARVITEPRRGYGQACLTGLAGASAPDVVVFLDGDYSHRPAELPFLLAPIIEGRADISMGSRLAGQRTPGALPWHAKFGNWLAASLITKLYELKISDLGPFRVARADVLRAVELEETTYGWAVEIIPKGSHPGFPRRRDTSKLSSSNRKIEDQQHSQRHRWSGLVHSGSDRKLLFPPAKKQHAAVSTKSHSEIPTEPQAKGDTFR
jgi:glycosyltransferase involved in cell wall biosynthesis